MAGRASLLLSLSVERYLFPSLAAATLKLYTIHRSAPETLLRLGVALSRRLHGFVVMGFRHAAIPGFAYIAELTLRFLTSTWSHLAPLQFANEASCGPCSGRSRKFQFLFRLQESSDKARTSSAPGTGSSSQHWGQHKSKVLLVRNIECIMNGIGLTMVRC